MSLWSFQGAREPDARPTENAGRANGRSLKTQQRTMESYVEVDVDLGEPVSRTTRRPYNGTGAYRSQELRIP